MAPGPSGSVQPDQPGHGPHRTSTTAGAAGIAQALQSGEVDWNAIFQALDEQAGPQPGGVNQQFAFDTAAAESGFLAPTPNNPGLIQEPNLWTCDIFDSSPVDMRPLPSRSQSYPNNWTHRAQHPAPDLNAPWSTPVLSPTALAPRSNSEYFPDSAFFVPASSSSTVDQGHSSPFRSLGQIIPSPTGDLMGRSRSHSIQHTHQHLMRQDSSGYILPQDSGYFSVDPSPAPTPLTNPTSGEDGEDKRVRNTVASAKFRAKKKQQVAIVQRNITDLEIQQAGLEADVASLRRENGLLKEMVQLKFGTKIPKE